MRTSRSVQALAALYKAERTFGSTHDGCDALCLLAQTDTAGHAQAADCASSGSSLTRQYKAFRREHMLLMAYGARLTWPVCHSTMMKKIQSVLLHLVHNTTVIQPLQTSLCDADSGDVRGSIVQAVCPMSGSGHSHAADIGPPPTVPRSWGDYTHASLRP
eukprot:scaffold32147_cov21-Tisochrysis_lutea.AAC.1